MKPTGRVHAIRQDAGLAIFWLVLWFYGITHESRGLMEYMAFIGRCYGILVVNQQHVWPATN